MKKFQRAVLETASGPVAKCALFLSGATRNLQIMDLSGPNLYVWQ